MLPNCKPERLQRAARMQAVMQFFGNISLSLSLARSLRSGGNPRSTAVFRNSSLPGRECREDRRFYATLAYVHIVIHIWLRIRLILSTDTVYGSYLDRNGSMACPRSRMIYPPYSSCSSVLLRVSDPHVKSRVKSASIFRFREMEIAIWNPISVQTEFYMPRDLIAQRSLDIPNRCERDMVYDLSLLKFLKKKKKRRKRTKRNRYHNHNISYIYLSNY